MTCRAPKPPPPTEATRVPAWGAGPPPAHVAMLRHLAAHPQSGALTWNLAIAAFGIPTNTSRAYTRMKVLAKRGLVRRHPDNDERWFITDAGLAGLRDLDATTERGVRPTEDTSGRAA